MRITTTLQKEDVPIFNPLSNFIIFLTHFTENFIYYEVQHNSNYNQLVENNKKIKKVIKNELLLMFK